MEKEIKEFNKEEASKLLQDDIKNGIGNIRSYVFNENNNLVEKHKVLDKNIKRD